MAVSQQFLLCDNSTATNFKNWAQAISNFIRTAGWTNSTDTGQLNGAGPGPTGWASVTTVPGANAFYYEVFQPGDGLQNFYLKMEYGNGGNAVTNCPSLRITIGTGTNGAGTLTGYVSGYGSPWVLSPSTFTAPSTTTTYECDFSGDAGRLSFLLWRNAPNNAPQVFGLQRSLNSSGSPTSSYVTIWGAGYTSGQQTSAAGFQQTLHFTAGIAPTFPSGIGSNSVGWPCLNITVNTGSLSFNGSIPVWFQQPMIGYWDYPCTVVGTSDQADLTEGVPFTITNQYGQTKTYMPTRAGWLSWVGRNDGSSGRTGATVCMEYD